jgi:hypothetical protein
MVEIILAAVRHLVLSLQVSFTFTKRKIEATSYVLAKAFDQLWILFLAFLDKSLCQLAGSLPGNAL